MNQFTLIGTIKGDTSIKFTSANVPYVNLTIENERVNPNGDLVIEEFATLLYGNNVDYYKDIIREDDFVYIKGHLKDNNYLKDGGEILYKVDLIIDRIYVINKK